ncbi:MAG: polymer-forming cytoskeletal protein [Pseudomonadota bacterium]
MFGKSLSIPKKSFEENKIAPSIISVDMRVTGNITTQGEIHIDGIVEGDVRGHSVTLGKSAEVHGYIEAEWVKIWGRLDGTVTGGDVFIGTSGEVVGDIIHDAVIIERGAVVQGRLKANGFQPDKKSAVELLNSPTKQLGSNKAAPPEKQSNVP